MAKTKAADDYPLPATLEGIRDRIAELVGDIELIGAQLQDSVRREELGADYAQWRSKAIVARAHKVREKRYLEAERAKLIADTNKARAAARSKRQAELAAEAQRKLAVLASSPDESQIIYELYRGLSALYRRTGEPLRDLDRAAFDRAYAYLVQAGVFTVEPVGASPVSSRS